MGVWSNAAKAVSNGFSKGMKGITNFFSKEAKAAGKAFAEETKTSAKAFASQEVKTAAKTAAGEAKAVAAEAGKGAQKAGKAFAGEAKAVGAEAGKSAKGAAKTVVEEAKVAGAEAKAGSKAATKAVGSAQKTAHGTQKAASESIQGVTGGNATGTVISVEAGKGTKNAASAAVKGLTNGNGVMNNIERIGGWGGKVATWGAEHPLAALMYSSLAYKFFTGNKVQDLAVELFTDKNTPEHSKTPAGILKSSIFGEEPIVGFAVDSFLGRGTYDGMTERYRYIEQEGVDAYRAGKEGVRGIGGELLDGYNLAKRCRIFPRQWSCRHQWHLYRPYRPQLSLWCSLPAKLCSDTGTGIREQGKGNCKEYDGAQCFTDGFGRIGFRCVVIVLPSKDACKTAWVGGKCPCCFKNQQQAGSSTSCPCAIGTAAVWQHSIQ